MAEGDVGKTEVNAHWVSMRHDCIYVPQNLQCTLLVQLVYKRERRRSLTDNREVVDTVENVVLALKEGLGATAILGAIAWIGKDRAVR